MFDFLTPYLGYVKAVAVAVVLAAVAYSGYWVTDLYHDKQELALANTGLTESLALSKKVIQVTNVVLARRVDNSKAISRRAANVQVEIEKRIPAAGLAPLPGAFRVLHDSAAADEVPPAPGGPDEVPVSPQQAAQTITGNYAICHDNADQLVQLQQWIKGVSDEGN
ncbi:hypothetical protein GNX71_18525 [Variovorax sp. RKNM96]|uniref:hypothetical protein n=1 Tax=Variovorax sp. RKNM96 TaxID=2681552 RepID=UPI001981363B|nr:hypothetical protein [Variovorax sp. RKNM96]QSI31465.1 hypothetical protein GNX71_18525 [Variovorax sp. RKNM96]